MEKEALGTVVSVKKQWWFKVNTKSLRKGSLDGAIFPHIIKVRYEADGKEYSRLKWVHATVEPPKVGEEVKVIYREEKPSKGKIVISEVKKQL